jgi:esterase/lipase
MNEASSKYVDQLVLDKLMTEKLQQVHHYPGKNIDLTTSVFDLIKGIEQKQLPDFVKSTTGFSFKSVAGSGYEENDVCPVFAFECKDPVASIVFTHGLYEDNRNIYGFLFSSLNKVGLNVYLCTLPFHYERKPKKSLFSGEYFWSADFERTRNAFAQGVFDVYSLYKFIQKRNNHNVFLTGYSMGGAVNLVLGAAVKEIQGVVAVNPATSLSEIVWDSPLCRYMKNDFLEAGYTWEQLQLAYKTFEPVSINIEQYNTVRFMICYALYDQVTSPDIYRQFIEKWHIRNVHEYKAGHLTTLRVPRLAQDIFNFINTL